MLLNLVKSVRNEEGQDLLEYTLLVALIALIAIGAVGRAGQFVEAIFQDIADSSAGRRSRRDLRVGRARFTAPAHRSVDRREESSCHRLLLLLN